MHNHLQHTVADEIFRSEAQDSQERQHPEGIDEVRQCLGGVVDLHHPAQVHVVASQSDMPVPTIMPKMTA